MVTLAGMETGGATALYKSDSQTHFIRCSTHVSYLIYSSGNTGGGAGGHTGWGGN